jgi:hypothetical protein
MKFISLIFTAMLSASGAIAGPGAHGPNGEHLDAPAGHVHNGGGPRIETFTETFELVAHLEADELSILVDRYATNEPVLNGVLEVEYKGIKAPATFHADHGDYAVTDPRLLKALAVPGKHALVFTLAAGEDSDLLEGTLEVGNDDTHSHGLRYRHWAAIAAVITALLAGAIVLCRRIKRVRNRA